MGTQTRSLSRNTIPLKVLWEFCKFPAPKKSTHKKALVFCERSGYWFIACAAVKCCWRRSRNGFQINFSHSSRGLNKNNKSTRGVRQWRAINMNKPQGIGAKVLWPKSRQFFINKQTKQSKQRLEIFNSRYFSVHKKRNKSNKASTNSAFLTDNIWF